MKGAAGAGDAHFCFLHPAGETEEDLSRAKRLDESVIEIPIRTFDLIKLIVSASRLRIKTP
jgi:hypothetical protein